MTHRESPGRLSEVYAVVLDYVCGRWGVDEADVVRPFWPGDDFEAFEYPRAASWSMTRRSQSWPGSRTSTLGTVLDS